MALLHHRPATGHGKAIVSRPLVTLPRPARRAGPRAVGNGNGAPVSGSRMGGITDPAIELVDGAVTSGPDLSVVVNGLKLPNPFVIGSGPPGTNYQVGARSFSVRRGTQTCRLAQGCQLDCAFGPGSRL